LSARRRIRLVVNGAPVEREVEARLLLSDFLRGELELTGTHVGCEHGVCGACTVLVDALPARACLMFAVQADGASVETVESLAQGGALHPLQQAFWETHAVHQRHQQPGLEDEHEIREVLAGNLCRCTGYQNIVDAVRLAAGRLRAQ